LLSRIVLAAIALIAGARAEFTIAGPFAAWEGETCVVCNSRLSRNGFAYIIDGQRMAVMNGMEREFLAHPDKYIRKMRPDGMLVTSQPLRTAGIAAPYFWAGVYVLIGLVFGGLCAHTALGKGYAPGPWFLLGFLFSIAAQLALLSRPSLRRSPVPPGFAKFPVTPSPVFCPACGTANHPSIRECVRCEKAMS
jgi:hypothetical protein